MWVLVLQMSDLAAPFVDLLHRRVTNSQHLSKHDTDRETYMEEYHLSPDALIAKAFRMIQSSRRGYYPHGKSDWIAAIVAANAAANKLDAVIARLLSLSRVAHKYPKLATI